MNKRPLTLPSALAGIGQSKVIVSFLLGLIFFLLTFTGTPSPLFAEDNMMISFGSGRVAVRLYTDYFCVPCRAAEPEIESLLAALMDKNAVTITFVDTPMHRETTLYAKYFLYILNANQHSFAHALSARAALFEAAAKNIGSSTELETFLSRKGLKFKPFGTAPFLLILEKFIREDNVNSTPSCVIATLKNKEKFVGGNNIVKGLKAIQGTVRDKKQGDDPAPTGH